MRVFTITEDFELKIFASEKEFLKVHGSWVDHCLLESVRACDMVEFFAAPYQAGDMLLSYVGEPDAHNILYGACVSLL
jgi:hypothetical protein